MRALYLRLIRKLLVLLITRIASRCPPSYAVPQYLDRWHLLRRNNWLNVYLHRFNGSDPSDPHDHEYINLSIILAGSYTEHLYREDKWKGSRLREAGDIVLRLPSSPHRLEVGGEIVWTLFICGPRVRRWGFWTPEGWMPQTVYKAREARARTDA